MKISAFYVFVSSFLLGIILRTLYEFTLSLWLVLLALGSIFFLAQFLARRYAYVFLAFIFLGLSLGGIRTSLMSTTVPSEFELLFGSRVVLSGTISSAPDSRESGERLTVTVKRDKATTKILAVTPSRATYHTGDIITVSGVLKAPKAFQTDGGREFAYDKFLAKDGIFGIIQPAGVVITGRNNSPLNNTFKSLESIKNTFTSSIEKALPEPESALAVGLIAGGKQGLGKSLLEAFTIAGLLQIIVLSGYNVMIVAEGIMKSVSFLPRRFSILLAGLGIIFFVACAGGGSSAVRAGAMAVFALVARATGKTYAVVRALFVTLVLMLLWNPYSLVYDPGLQFSFIATLGLILFTPYVSLRLVRITNATLREVIATTIAAQIAVLPILLWQTGNLSLVALPATVLVMPVIPFAMAFSAIAGVAGFLFGTHVPILALLIGLPAYVLLAYVISVAEISASLPYAHVIVLSFPFWIVVCTYILMGYLYNRVQKKMGVTGVAPIFLRTQTAPTLPKSKNDVQPRSN